MKIASFSNGGRARLGIVEEDTILDLSAADSALPGELGALLASGGLQRLELFIPKARRIPLTEVRLLQPVARPGKIVCAGLNYRSHALEAGLPIPEKPPLFLRCATSLTGPQEAIIRPACSDTLDYEAELAIVIGQHARSLSAAQALSAVAGYTCFNDGSVREYQRHSRTMTSGKNFDSTGAFGPWIVTPDELPEGAAGLQIECRLNGQVMQSNSTSQMIFGVADLIAYISTCMTLEPGDLVITGTPEGVGAARTPPVWMRAGDTVEVEIEGIGKLVNHIAHGAHNSEEGSHHSTTASAKRLTV